MSGIKVSDEIQNEKQTIKICKFWISSDTFVPLTHCQYADVSDATKYMIISCTAVNLL